MNDEFLITNRLGSYCSSTFHSGNIRKYHGLLVVADKDFNRKVILDRLEEKIILPDKETYISTNLYKNFSVFPNGSKWLEDTQIDPFVKYEYNVYGIHIQKNLNIYKNRNSIKVTYVIESPIDFKFVISPLVTNRDYHTLKRYSDLSNQFENFIDNNDLIIKLADSNKKFPYLVIKSPNDFVIKSNPDIYRDFVYPEEMRRGYEYMEDLVKVDDFECNVKTGKSKLELIFHYIDGKDNTILPDQPKFSETTFKLKNTKISELYAFLIKRGEDFITYGNNRTSIIAGFPWFEDWGRDTFFSFNGLLLCTEKYEYAKEILLEWGRKIRFGLVPNRPGKNEYNSIDATLLYIISTYRYFEKTDDYDTLKTLFPIISESIQNIISGTKYGIEVLSNAMLISKDKTKALTWMDIVIDNKPETPRLNAAVEIQMLWFNVLNIYKEIERILFGQENDYYISLLCQTLENSFDGYFWNKTTNFVNDSVSIYGGYDASIRPNAVLGLSLPYKLIPNSRAKEILATIENKLLTPLGLMTLAPDDSNFHPEYVGDQIARDKAYHNGTIWPWLLGEYLKSYLKVYGNNTDSRMYVEEKLLKFWKIINKKQLYYIPEVFSAVSHTPGGTLSQAWNYATLIEVCHLLEKQSD